MHVRTEEHTRGRVPVARLAYLIRCEMSYVWDGLNGRVEEGLAQLAALCLMEVKVKVKVKVEGGTSCLRVPVPDDQSRALLQAASVRVPEVPPHFEARVVTRRSRPSRREAAEPTQWKHLSGKGEHP